MKIKRLWTMIVVCLLCFAFGQAYAYRTMILENTWLEHGVTQNGVQGIKVHCQVYLADYKDQEVKVVAYFYKAKGEMLPDLNGKYRTANGKVATSKKLKPKSDEGVSSDVELFIPIDELHLKSGTHTYYCRVHIIDPDSQRVKSDYMKFEAVGAEQKVVEVVNTWIEHGVTQNGTNGIKVHSELKVHGYKGQDVEYVIGLYDENKNPHKNPIGITKLIPSYDHSEWKDASIFIPLGDLALKEGKHTYYCIANVVAGDGTRGIGEFVSFDGTGPVKKVVEVVNTWIEHGVTQNGTNGIKVHSELKVHGYKGQDVEYVIGLYDENKNPHKNPIGITKLIPSYDHSEWKDASIFIPLRDLALKEGKHTYYCIANVVAGDGTRGIGEFVSFDGTGAAQNQPQHNHNHNKNHADNNKGKLQQAPVYHGKREGRYYYISETYQQGSFNFYFLSGEYVADAPGLHNVYGALTRYIMTNETADYYIFKQAKVLFNGGFEFLDYAPQMKISKGWNYILIEKASPLDRSDLVYVKEISKEDYDEISRNKQAYLNRIGVSNGGNNNGGSSVDMSPNNSHIDKNCQYCGGGGGCSSCNGTGLKYNPYGGYYEECPSCRGSKRCFNCRGTGKQATY